MRALILALGLMLCSLPALAGGYVTLSCPEGIWIREFMIGSGQQIRGQGLEVWPMLCTATGQFEAYARVANPDAFARLEAFTRRDMPDDVEVSFALNLAQDLGDRSVENLFGRVEGLTFGDVRSTVANIARPTGQPVAGTTHQFWRHPTCAGYLVPFDFYMDSAAACPACPGGRLLVDSSSRTQWD